MRKYSKQREEILEILKNVETHPTAEEIYLALKQKNSTVSRGTVYRNLNLLMQQEDILKIFTPDSADRYDYMKKPHHHIICKNCGSVYDFEYILDDTAFRQTIEKQTPIASLDTNIILYGICNDCRNALEKNNI